MNIALRNIHVAKIQNLSETAKNIFYTNQLK